jgi:hypothetical protein
MDPKDKQRLKKGKSMIITNSYVDYSMDLVEERKGKENNRYQQSHKT